MAETLSDHASDCATKNAPALEPRECDCGADILPCLCKLDMPSAAHSKDCPRYYRDRLTQAIRSAKKVARNEAYEQVGCSQGDGASSSHADVYDGIGGNIAD
jgi:hypothetical protein